MPPDDTSPRWLLELALSSESGNGLDGSPNDESLPRLELSFSEGRPLLELPLALNEASTFFLVIGVRGRSIGGVLLGSPEYSLAFEVRTSPFDGIGILENPVGPVFLVADTFGVVL